MKSGLEYERQTSAPGRCSWCGEPIYRGGRYVWFTSYTEEKGYAGSCSMHPACFEVMFDSSTDYFEKYVNERP